MDLSKDKTLVAQVGDKKLFLNDIALVLPDHPTRQDTIDFLNFYATDWIRKELKRQKSQELFRDQQEDIEKLVEEYRNSLLTYKYEQQFTAGVDTVVTEAEMEEYYRKNSEQLKLSTPIVKAGILRVPVKYNGIRKLRETFLSKENDRFYDALKMAEKQGFRFSDFTTAWTPLSTIAEYLPFNYKNANAFVASNSNYEVEDDEYIYLMNILEKKNIGETIPLDMIRPTIKRAIVNIRKKEHMQQVEDSLYQQAIRENTAVLEKIDTTFIRSVKQKKK